MSAYIDVFLNEWKIDGVVDREALDATASATSALHQKYLAYYTKNNLLLRDEEIRLEHMKRLKKSWMEGKLSKAKLDDLGWPYDPFNGAKKPLKTEMKEHIEVDDDVVVLRKRVSELQTAKEVLKEILGQINWRHQNLRIILDTRKFEAGF